MLKNISDIRTIAAALAVLYGISFFIYLQYLRAPIMQHESLILLFIFGLLFVATIAVIQLKEWGRFMLIVLNFLLAGYLIRPYLTLEDFFPFAYVMMCLIVVLFFNQDRIKIRFKTARVASGPWRSVLVIDDDEGLIKTVRPLLISHGFSVLTATSGEDGLTVAKTQKPDIILLDVILPGIKGRDVCRAIKDDPATKHIPVIFFTAKDSADDIRAEMEAGAEDHITKPIDPRTLINTIDGILKS
jgi:CheY-like chemotaxis protein